MMMKRDEQIGRIAAGDSWDVAVIGGGATGLGVAVDAQTRGYRTVLIEAEDFAKGTSSRSTKLVHGGVRYLEQGDIPLVLEALHERGLLHQNAPHLVHHQSFIVPRYQWWEGPFFGLGLKMYDLLAGKLNLESSRILDFAETVRRIPNIEQDKLLGGVEYFDGQFDDARLAIALARTAFDHGACVANYVRATGIVKRDGLVAGVDVVDLESGQALQISAKVVINATGVFADSVRRLDDAACAPAVQPSQGVHLVFDRRFLRGDSAIMVPHTDDGRVLFVIPWHGKVLVGTTDTPMATAEIEPRPLEEEIGFILRNASRYLAEDPSRDDVLSVFAGQRPLVRPPGAGGGATKQISRNHEVIVSDTGLVTIVGGKWTTYRKMGQDTVDHAATIGGLPDRECVTKSLMIHGSDVGDRGESNGVRGVYGSDAGEIDQIIQDRPEFGNLLHPRLPYLVADVIWAVRSEMARTVDDVLARRTRSLLLDAAAAIESADAVADILADELGKSVGWAEEQAAAFREVAAGYLMKNG